MMVKSRAARVAERQRDRGCAEELRGATKLMIAECFFSVVESAQATAVDRSHGIAEEFARLGPRLTGGFQDLTGTLKIASSEGK